MTQFKGARLAGLRLGYGTRVMADILGLDALLGQMMTALGLAMVAGNGFAMWKHARGEAPEGARGAYRPGRVRFLLAVGLVISIWGLAGWMT